MVNAFRHLRRIVVAEKIVRYGQDQCNTLAVWFPK